MSAHVCDCRCHINNAWMTHDRCISLIQELAATIGSPDRCKECWREQQQ